MFRIGIECVLLFTVSWTINDDVIRDFSISKYMSY